MSTSTMELDYDIEKILDHVSFLEAHEQFYKNDNQQYSFIDDRFNKSTKSQKVMNYYFLIKWVGYGGSETEITWEPENEIPDSVYLFEYKTLNNLRIERVILDVTFTSEKGRNYVAPTIDKETFVSFPEAQFRSLNRMWVTIRDNMDNGKFGMIPVPKFRKVKEWNKEYLKKGNEQYFMKNTVQELKETTEGTIKSRIDATTRKYHKMDRSFLQGMIKHSNIVKLLDCFYTLNGTGNSFTVSSIFEFSPMSLRQKIENDREVEWKKVAKDMLSALTLLHTYGIHQGISVDSIYCHGGEFKLSNFKEFTLKKSIMEDDVKSCGVEYAPRKYGLSSPFNYTIDVFAWAVVLLQCHVGMDLIPSKPQTVAHLDRDLCDAIAELETLEDRLFVMMMIEARIWLDQGAGDFRCTAKALLTHPVLQEKKMESVECYFLPSLLHCPFREHLFYKNDDTVQEVLNRLLSLYQVEPTQEYLMALTKNVAVWEKTIIVDSNRNFKHLVERNEIMNFIVFPVIKLYEGIDHEIFIISYEQELGGCPILVHTKEIKKDDKKDQKDLALFVNMVTNAVVSRKYRHHRISLESREDGSNSDFADTPAAMKVIDVPVENRFVKFLKWQKTRLDFGLLQWEDLAGQYVSEPADSA